MKSRENCQKSVIKTKRIKKVISDEKHPNMPIVTTTEQRSES